MLDPIGATLAKYSRIVIFELNGIVEEHIFARTLGNDENHIQTRTTCNSKMPHYNRREEKTTIPTNLSICN